MSSSRLRLNFCAQDAALYSVKNWHYSRSLPTPPLIRIGVWEDDKFIGVVLFSRGASAELGRAYGVTQTGCCELSRVALRTHKAPVTRIIRIAITLLRKQCPGLRVIISFADTNQGHHGGIYQGGNWVYTGKTSSCFIYIDKQGKRWHSRQISKTGLKKQYGEMRACVKEADCQKVLQEGKHRYVMPLDAAMTERVRSMRKPYPKRESAA
ncbi:MAG: protein Mom [Cytophagaceae bacterium]|nr:MAG: protein Mom [Cytophagaceae bacterium]